MVNIFCVNRLLTELKFNVVEIAFIKPTFELGTEKQTGYVYRDLPCFIQLVLGFDEK